MYKFIEKVSGHLDEMFSKIDASIENLIVIPMYNSIKYFCFSSYNIRAMEIYDANIQIHKDWKKVPCVFSPHFIHRAGQQNGKLKPITAINGNAVDDCSMCEMCFEKFDKLEIRMSLAVNTNEDLTQWISDNSQLIKDALLTVLIIADKDIELKLSVSKAGIAETINAKLTFSKEECTIDK